MKPLSTPTIRKVMGRARKTGESFGGRASQLMLQGGEIHHYLCQHVPEGRFSFPNTELPRREFALCCLPTLEKLPPALRHSDLWRSLPGAAQAVAVQEQVEATKVPESFEEALEVLHVASYPYTVQAERNTIAPRSVLHLPEEAAKRWQEALEAAVRIVREDQEAVRERCEESTSQPIPNGPVVVKTNAEKMMQLRERAPIGLARALLGLHHQVKGRFLYLPGHVVEVWERAGYFNPSHSIGLRAPLQHEEALEVLEVLLSERPDSGSRITPEELVHLAEAADLVLEGPA